MSDAPEMRNGEVWTHRDGEWVSTVRFDGGPFDGREIHMPILPFAMDISTGGEYTRDGPVDVARYEYRPADRTYRFVTWRRIDVRTTPWPARQ